MDEKKREGAIGYRPSDAIKGMFDNFCGGGASISRPQLIEVAMQFLKAQGEERMKEIIVSYLLNQPLVSDKKGEHRKTA